MIGAGRPLRVAFDHWVFSDQLHGGISRHFATLVAHLPACGIEPRVLAPLYRTERLREAPRELVWGGPVGPGRRQQLAAKAIGRAAARPLARLFRADVLQETFYSASPTGPPGCPVVVTIHDCLHDHFPDEFPGDSAPRNKPKSLARAAWVICNSEHSRRDFLERNPDFAKRTSVVHCALDWAFDAEAAPPGPLHPRPYVLFVAAVRRPYKNLEGLVDAFARSRLPGEGIDLVCIGDAPFTTAERERIAAAGVTERVHQRRATDADLRSWYRHALLFAYPSLYEGFGLPPLEAMASDCPVVTMNVSAMPEVCGAAAEYAEPGDLDSLVAALERVAFDPARASALRAAGRARLPLFTPQKCAEETAKVYRMLA
jgi:glycosyltransferase involved in cell wall biosynthesis